MLKLDVALAAVETVEADVDSLYQSVNQVEIALEGYASQPCEAFICGLNPGEKGRVYAGINLMREKKTLVYTAGNLGVDRGRYGDALQAALDFLEPLGFQLKEVNLNYSAAMRQVILKGVTGIRLPGSGKPEWKQRLEEVVATQEATLVTTAKETAKKALKPQVAPPPAPEEKPAPPVAAAPPPRKREGGDDVTAMLRIDIARLEEKVAALEAEAAPRKTRMEKLERELQQERERSAAVAEEQERAKREAEKSATTANRTIAALKKELDAAKGELASLKGRVEEEQKGLRAEVKSLQARNNELEQLRAREEQELSRRLTGAEEEAAGLRKVRAELEQRLRQQEEDHEQELVRLVALAAEAEVRGDEQLQGHRRETHQRLMAMRQVMDRLWEAVGDEAMPAGDDLLQRIATAIVPSPAPRRAVKPAPPVAALTVEEGPAMTSEAALPLPVPEAGEAEPLATGMAAEPDSAVAEAVMEEEESVAEPEVEADAGSLAPGEEEVEADDGTAGEEVAAEQRSRLAELFSPEGPAVTPEPVTPPVPVRETEAHFGAAAPPPSTPPTWGRSPMPEAPPEMFASFDLTGGFGGEIATTFLLDEGQAGLTVPVTGLLEIYRSANVQRIAPTGGAQVEGLAYVCAFREGGSERVVAILEMKEGGERFVYLPGDPSLARESLVRSALAFLEDIGFFMLAEELPDDPAQRKECLEGWAPFVSWEQ